MTGNSNPDGRERLPQEIEQPEHKDALLDDPLEDSFPASDPVSVVSPGKPTAPRREDEIDRPSDPDESTRG